MTCWKAVVVNLDHTILLKAINGNLMGSFPFEGGSKVAKLSPGMFLQKTAVAATHFMAVRQEAVLSLEP